MLVADAASATISPASGNIAINTSASTNGGNVAIVSPGQITLGSSGSITTSGSSSNTSGSLYASSGTSVTLGSVTLSGGALLVTTEPGNSTVTSLSENTTSNLPTFSTGVDNILTTDAAGSVTTLPSSYTSGTITPKTIPGGGFTSFSNSGSVQLATDSGGTLTFNRLVPIVVTSAGGGSLGTISESGTINANFTVVANSISATSVTVGSSGSVNLYASGNVGTGAVTTPVSISAPTLTASTITGNVYVTDSTSVSLAGVFSGAVANITDTAASGTMTVSNPISAVGAVTLQAASGTNGSIAVNNFIAGSSVTLTANGSGTVSAPTSSNIYTNSLSITSPRHQCPFADKRHGAS